MLKVEHGDLILVDDLSWMPWQAGTWKIIRNSDGVPELRPLSDLREGLDPRTVTQRPTGRSDQWVVLFPRCLAFSRAKVNPTAMTEGIVVQNLKGEVIWTDKYRDWSKTLVVHRVEW